MKVAIWDTYVKKSNGNVLHFDIVVDENNKDKQLIYSYGKEYLNKIGEKNLLIESSQCQFCHIEEITKEWKNSIAENGYFIIEMEEIPLHLSAKPNRKEMILYLRANSDNYRFADFKNKTDKEIIKLVNELV